MEWKFSVLFGVILAVIVLAVTTFAWMANPAYVDAAAIITIIIMALLLTKLYVGKVKVPVNGMVTTIIVWLIIVALLDLAYASAFGLDLAAYYSNQMIYVGYIVLIICALVGYKLFSGKAAPKTEAKPVKKKSGK